MISNNVELHRLDKETLTVIQNYLAKLGYYQVLVDGLFGKHTGHAFAEWKADNHLGSPTVIGPASFESLRIQSDSAVDPNEVDWTDFYSKVGHHFTVGEVCMNDRARIPVHSSVKKNVINLAKELDRVRDAFGQPIIVTSWYRPERINRAVGGVRNSTHIQGLAADIRPAKGSVEAFQNWIRPRWFGALGLGAHKGFVHLDIRNGKGYETGGKRGPIWNY